MVLTTNSSTSRHLQRIFNHDDKMGIHDNSMQVPLKFVNSEQVVNISGMGL